MAEIKVPIYVRPATSRMTRRQHVERSLVAIIAEGGLPIDNGDVIMPAPVLFGRSEETLAPIGQQFNLPYSTDLETIYKDPPENAVFFEGGPTSIHYEGLGRAIDSGLNIYTEKPVTLEIDEALDLANRAAAKGIRAGVVQDKRYLPGPLALSQVIQQGLIGEPYHLLLEFGYFVHPDDGTRPDWNSDKAEGGGIILDMVAHWDYLLKMLVGQPKRVVAHSAMHIAQRTRDGQPVPTTAEDSIYATFEVDGPGAAPILCTTVSSWCRRPRKRGLLEIKIQGTQGAAEAYLDRCYYIANKKTPQIAWDPDSASREDFHDGWERFEATHLPGNAFRHQWELYLKHLITDSENPASLLDGAQGVETALCSEKSALGGNAPIDIRNVHTIAG
jgi:predicted dehydrogenase